MKKSMKNNCGENRCTGCVRLPEDGQLRAWVECSDCWRGEYVAEQGAYWCHKFGGYDPRGGCAKGEER